MFQTSQDHNFLITKEQARNFFYYFEKIMGPPAAKEYPVQYFLASALAATGCYPLWRSAAIGQSGFEVAALNVGRFTIPQALTPYVWGFLPP